MTRTFTLCTLAASLALVACTSVPPGPTQTALPGTGKSYDQFRLDDMDCRQYAQADTGDDPNHAAARSGAKSAAIGTGVGALAGLALGGTGRGAAVGAGVGLLAGSAIGAGNAQNTANSLQSRYDNSYTQCMYGKGNKVAVNGGYMAPNAPPPPPPAAAPYPPPGYPPPPPGYTQDQNYSR